MIPGVSKSDYSWEGNIELESWNKLYEQDLAIRLIVGGDSEVDKVIDHHYQAYNYISLNQQKILRIIFDAVYEHYPIWKDEYDYDKDEKSVPMPDIASSIELKELLYPIRIFIMDVDVEGVSYFGIEFKCKWEKEHGLGIMLYKDRVVDVGYADKAFLSWVAEADKDSM
jgi:hypothetical protein